MRFIQKKYFHNNRKTHMPFDPVYKILIGAGISFLVYQFYKYHNNKNSIKNLDNI